MSEKADERLAEVIKPRASSSIAAASVDVAVQNLDVQKGKPLVTDDVRDSVRRSTSSGRSCARASCLA